MLVQIIRAMVEDGPVGHYGANVLLYVEAEGRTALGNVRMKKSAQGCFGKKVFVI